jgi:hypothetical protein
MLQKLNGTNNPMQMMQQLNQFKQMMRGRDPQQMVNELVRQGKMTPEQLEVLKKQAQAFGSMLR